MLNATVDAMTYCLLRAVRRCTPPDFSVLEQAGFTKAAIREHAPAAFEAAESLVRENDDPLKQQLSDPLERHLSNLEDEADAFRESIDTIAEKVEHLRAPFVAINNNAARDTPNLPSPAAIAAHRSAERSALVV